MHNLDYHGKYAIKAFILLIFFILKMSSAYYVCIYSNAFDNSMEENTMNPDQTAP